MHVKMKTATTDVRQCFCYCLEVETYSIRNSALNRLSQEGNSNDSLEACYRKTIKVFSYITMLICNKLLNILLIQVSV